MDAIKRSNATKTLNEFRHYFVFQLLLERKSTEVGKLIEETEKNIKELAENINQAKVKTTLTWHEHTDIHDLRGRRESNKMPLLIPHWMEICMIAARV